MPRLWLMLSLMLSLLLAAPATAAAAAQEEADSAFWQRAGDRITFTTGRFSFPVDAGAIRLVGPAEFSRQGQGLDTGLQYLSPDERVFATVYVYYPGLPHAGVSAFATDHAIRFQSGDRLRQRGSQLVGAGGREGMAIRLDYSGFRPDRLASSAAFIKAGRWILKLRVSGPESRRAEVEGAMTALLEGMRFEGETVPRAPEPLEIAECRAPAGDDAALLPLDAAEAMEDAITGLLDGVGRNGREEAADHSAGTPILGRRWCRSSLNRIGGSTIPILRAGPAAAAGADAPTRRSVLIATITDSGTLLEVVETHFRGRTRFALFHHEIGRTRLLGAYDAVPTDRQIVALLSGNDRAGTQVRATIMHLAEGNSDVTVHVSPTAGAVPVT